MSRPAIIVDNLGKRYRIGRASGKLKFSESLTAALKSPFRRLRDPLNGGSGTEEFWALKGVSFELQSGDVVGIVGRNGAGKSTLLKILSRITEPTEGSIRFRGRIASLLEVGTGFHPDLTGRENVYLNGSILGMRKAEIDRKFDEIVAFAEIEKFLDTQVKHYSSGMYVRLAFAVAAHLDPDILVVDEVLAVGDAAFQKKCLGKIRQVASGGRTVLFVSHNMPTILQLCDRVILLKGGVISHQGSPDEVVYEYQLNGQCEGVEVRDLGSLTRPSANKGGARFQSCRLITPDRTGPWTFSYGSRVTLEVTLSVHRPLSCLEFGLALCNSMGVEVVSPLSSDVSPRMAVEPGEYTIVAGLPTLRLTPGRYQLDFGLRSDRGAEDHVTEAAFFEVLYNNESSENLMHLRRGSVIPDFEFSINQVQTFS